jgi:hypothetical protein
MNTGAKSYYRAELAELYGVRVEVFSKWIKSLGLRYVRIFTPKQVQQIFEELGEPE